MRLEFRIFSSERLETPTIIGSSSSDIEISSEYEVDAAGVGLLTVGGFLGFLSRTKILFWYGIGFTLTSNIYNIIRNRQT